MAAESAINVFNSRRDGFLAALDTFLRFTSISTDPQHQDELRRCAAWVRQQLADAGLVAEVLPTEGHPVVFADSGPVAGHADAPTVLVYGHYDVQPPGNLDQWRSPPFEPTIRDGAIFARGAADDKGQLMTHLAALRCWHESGEPLPVRVKCLLEGEEEIGSPHLPSFIQAHRDRLACDVVALSDTSKLDEDTPALTYATRGLVYKELIVHGPSRDLHSGQHGGAVANPANVLARLIASLHDSQQRVAIAGFYDDVLPLSREEREALATHGVRDEALLATTGSPAACGESGFTTAERCTARPTLDVNGLWGGFAGEGSATIIPALAGAKISMRLVANQRAEAISAAFDQAVRALCPGTVHLEIRDKAHCDPYTAPTDSPAVTTARQALADAYGREPVLVREGGTLPILPLFKRILDADSVMLGFAVPGCNLHSPNEFFHVSDFERGTRCILRFLEQAGRMQS